MTHITKEQIEKFQKIYKESFGLELSHQEALEIGTRLVVLGEICLSLNDKQLGKD